MVKPLFCFAFFTPFPSSADVNIRTFDLFYSDVIVPGLYRPTGSRLYKQSGTSRWVQYYPTCGTGTNFDLCPNFIRAQFSDRTNTQR